MATQQWKYHVFISFRGEDTRHNFVCHLYDALSRKGLKTFLDNQLRRGEEINPALLQAIHDSKVAVVIFSQNYASSSWCLDELLKIIECYETHNQIVLPVFYRVNPSDVRKQNGKFEESLAKHSENPRYSNKIRKWKAALTKAASISGRSSNAIREDNALIDQIVRDILEKLEHLYPCSLEGFVGLDRKISQVKTLLATGSSDVRVLGIWGMGGIGKTTLAEAIFAQVSTQFEGHCFLSDVREASEKGGKKKLLKQLISDLLGERDVKIDTTNIVPGLQRLKCKTVFVVFDDVSDRSQLEPLIGPTFCCFRTGSILIITSRDKQVFRGITDNIYEVDALSCTESYELFVRNAYPLQDHMPLLDSFVNYAGGNPLAIKVLGSYVSGEGVELWKEALNKLSKCPNQDIHNVLKLSYDGLDREEKAIFLHIACFFKGENINKAKRVFRSCGLSANIGVSRLVGKSLVTISNYDELDMHDLLQKMGREIVRQESNDPEQRSRLWDFKEIRNVLEKNKGTEAIESIILNTSQIRDMVLDPNVFKRMPNLKFLRFYTSWGERSKLHLTGGLHFLPSALRYLYWDDYSLESLPTDFDAKELLVLGLPRSNIKQILKAVKDAGKLKAVAQFLIESPLICHVTNIASGILPSGIGNIKVPSSSCQFLSKITSLDMRCCQNLKSFPNNVDFQCLEILNVEGCSNLDILPVISTELRKLNVGRTAIKEVHLSSIEHLSKLEDLCMAGCRKLESLPTNICKLQALQILDLEFCSSLKKFPEIFEPMYNLREALFSFSGIEVIPSSIDNMKGLERLDLRHCLNLACLPEIISSQFLKVRGMRRTVYFGFSTLCKHRKKPLKPLNLFEDLECLLFSIFPSFFYSQSFDATVRIYTKHDKVEAESLVSECVSYLIDLPSHPCLRFFSPYYILDLSRCSIRELPKDLGSLYYLRRLELSSSNLEEIPASIKQLSLLESLRLDDCPKLRSLPQLPTSLCHLSAVHCESLKTLLAFKQPFFNGGKMNFNFNYCLKLEKKECEAMAYKVLRNGPKDVTLSYSDNRIPEWFWHQAMGDIIKIKLPSNWLVNPRFLGFALCIVCNTLCDPSEYVGFECYFQDKYNPTTLFKYQTNFYMSPIAAYDQLMQQQVLVRSLHDFNVWISENRQLFVRRCINMASFKFCTPDAGHSVIKNCGITPLYVQVDEGYVQGDDDDDHDDADEYAYWMQESLLWGEMSTKKKMKKIKDHDEDMNSEDTDDVMIPENEFFETLGNLFENEFSETVDNLFENGLSEAND